MTHKIKIPSPHWESNLTKIILELEQLRTKKLWGEIPAHIFFQLKTVFQNLETLGSARIEGNNTTLSEFVETIINANETGNNKDEKKLELQNLDSAIQYIEKDTERDEQITRAFISDLHKLVTKDLTPPPKGEGSNSPGSLRPIDVKINDSCHKPPEPILLQDEFDSFLSFINEKHAKQNELLMVALAHHEFMRIHPFDNGNGRVGRLLTYALLIKLGFNVKAGRIINPSAVFYTDRDKYYAMLATADSLQGEDRLTWSEYFLDGIRNQVKKIDKLTQKEFTTNNILLPALEIAFERQHITRQEFDILRLIINQNDMKIKASDLDASIYNTSQKKSYAIKKLLDKKMIFPISEGGRIYTISFVNNYMLRGIINKLSDEGYIPDSLNQ